MTLCLFLESRRKAGSCIDIENDRGTLFFLLIFNLKFNAYFKALIEFINEEPHRYRDEMVDFLQDRFDVEVSLATINRTLKKHKISWKKVIFERWMKLLILATKDC